MQPTGKEFFSDSDVPDSSKLLKFLQDTLSQVSFVSTFFTLKLTVKVHNSIGTLCSGSTILPLDTLESE